MSKNYSVTEKECLAAVMAVNKFRPYVEIIPFTIVTDHASLKWLMSLKDLTAILARWSLQLQAFDLDIEHRKGSENIAADTHSRLQEDGNVDELNVEDFFEFETTEFQSDEYLELIKHVEENKDRLSDIKVEDGIICKKVNFERGKKTKANGKCGFHQISRKL